MLKQRVIFDFGSQFVALFCELFDGRFALVRIHENTTNFALASEVIQRVSNFHNSGLLFSILVGSHHVLGSVEETGNIANLQEFAFRIFIRLQAGIRGSSKHDAPASPFHLKKHVKGFFRRCW